MTAPNTPPTNINAPSVPASVGVNPRGRIIFSTHVVMPLKIPNPINETNKYNQNDLTVKACLSPSNIKARTWLPSGPGGVGGFSFANSKNKDAENAVTPPYIN